MVRYMVRIIYNWVRQERHLVILDFRVFENGVPQNFLGLSGFLMYIFPYFPYSNVLKTATRDRYLHVSAIFRSRH